jgi:DNA invertase Pin-like site-specific DNA recombinase
MLVMQIRQVAAHKKMLSAAEWQERQLVQQLDAELKQPRSPGRPRGLDRLDPEKRTEIIREVVRLDLERVSRPKIAKAVRVSERQVDRILGENRAA